MDTRGYYKTLGVAENATQDEIKSAYKKLAMKWHPDRWVNGTDDEKKKAEDEFKKIGEAYGVLGNEEKRQNYDAGADENGFGPGAGGFDPFEAMRQAASRGGFGDFFSGFRSGAQRPAGNKGANVEAYVTLTLQEAINGAKKEVTIKKSVKCPDCHGTGSEDGQEHKCPYCNGTGMEQRTERRGNMFTMYQTPCSHCGGTGKQIDHPCKKCVGTGFVDKNEKLTLDIPVGMRNGMTVIFGGLGEEGTGGYPNGDLYLHIAVTEEVPGYFKSYDKDLNIYHEEKVNFVDALLGTKIKVKCPDGKDWEIKLRECTQPGERFTKTNSGYIQTDGYYAHRGDYVVIIAYDVPSSLTKKQKKALEDYKNEK